MWMPVPRRLFQQLLQIKQIMAGDDDERPLFNGQRHFNRLRIAKGPGVGGIQQLHGAVAGLAGLLHQVPQRLVGKAGGANGFQRGAVEPVQLRVDAAQHPRVIVVGRHAAQAEQDKAFQAAHVLVRLVPELLHVVVKADAGAGGVDVFGELIDGLRVKIDIGDGGEQPLHQQQGLLRGRGAPLADQLCGVGDQRTGQPILCGSGFGGFTAYPGAPGAGGAVRGLLTLKAKHRIRPYGSSLSGRRYPKYGRPGGTLCTCVGKLPNGLAEQLHLMEPASREKLPEMRH